MNCHKATWPWDCPRRRDADGRLLIPCEFRAHVHDARCVAIMGTMLYESERLVMTQQPGHNWMARLLLTPGPYTARLHVLKETLNLPWASDFPDTWEVTFDVPKLQGDARHTVELRLWLHYPFIMNPIGGNPLD